MHKMLSFLKKAVKALFNIAACVIILFSAQMLFAPQDALKDTRWLVTHIGQERFFSKRLPPDVEFSEGEVSGLGPCNGYKGEYRVYGNILYVSNMFSTVMGCGEGNPADIDPKPSTRLMDLESRMFRLLSSFRYFRIQGDTLTIYSRSDSITAQLQPAEAGAKSEPK